MNAMSGSKRKLQTADPGSQTSSDAHAPLLKHSKASSHTLADPSNSAHLQLQDLKYASDEDDSPKTSQPSSIYTYGQLLLVHLGIRGVHSFPRVEYSKGLSGLNGIERVSGPVSSNDSSRVGYICTIHIEGIGSFTSGRVHALKANAQEDAAGIAYLALNQRSF